MDYYLREGNDEYLPMRLQFFVPCVASPVFPYMQDYYVVNAVTDVDEFNELLSQTNLWNDPKSPLRDSPPYWFNISHDYYRSEIGRITDPSLREMIAKKYENVTEFIKVFKILDENQHCLYSKGEIREERFLFCTYLKDNLDMITVTQVIGSILLVIITIIGIPAIRKFEWAGRANLVGMFNGQKKVKKPHARAKRHK
jgi:hypothetical protein